MSKLTRVAIRESDIFRLYWEVVEDWDIWACATEITDEEFQKLKEYDRIDAERKKFLAELKSREKEVE